MRKLFSSACFLCLFFLWVPLCFSQIPVMPAAPAPAVFERIGVVAATKGKVELTTPGQAGRIASSGEPVFMGDEVRTDDKGHLQILLLDETVFTIGPNSAIVIDEFVYDPKTEKGKIQASITKGVFRYVSGKIAAKSPDSVSVKLPTATLGFRGTIVAGQVNQDGGSLAALLGPGVKNNAGVQVGNFVMSGTGAAAGQNQEVSRAGFGVEAGADGNISGVFQLSNEQIGFLTSGLSPATGGNSGTGGQEGGGTYLGPQGNISAISGEQTVLALSNAVDTMSFTTLINDIYDTSEKAAQDLLDSSGESALNPLPKSVSVTQASDPRFLERTGLFHYQHFDGHFIFSSGGTDYMGKLKGSIDIDFLDSVHGGNVGGAHSPNLINSYVEIDVPDISLQDRCDLTASNLPATGPAVFQWTNLSGVNGGAFDVFLELQNVETATEVKVADQAKVVVEYANSGDTGSGDMIAPISGPGPTSTPPSV